MSDSVPDPAPARERRASVIIRALVETSGATVDCRVRNLSRSGACIDNDAARLTKGQRVLVTMGTLQRLRGTVAWSNDRLAGLQFEGASIDLDSARKPRSALPATQAATGAGAPPSPGPHLPVASIGAGWLAEADDPYRKRGR